MFLQNFLIETYLNRQDNFVPPESMVQKKQSEPIDLVLKLLYAHLCFEWEQFVVSSMVTM